jgi:hypothetical protein
MPKKGSEKQSQAQQTYGSKKNKKKSQETLRKERLKAILKKSNE